MLNSIIEYLNFHPIWRRTVSLWNLKYRAPSADRLLALFLHRIGLMGKKEHEIFKRFIQPGMITADIGANQGLYTLFFSQLVGPQGSVLAFEPEPRLFQATQENCQSNHLQNTRLFNLALGEGTGTVCLHRSVFNSGDNRLNPSIKVKSGVQVQIEPLDRLLSDDRQLDFVKIDVQGHELSVLKGMKSVIAANPKLKIYFEYWPHGIRNAGASPIEVLEFLTDAGFQLYSPKLELLKPSNFVDFTSQFADTDFRYVNLIASKEPLSN